MIGSVFMSVYGIATEAILQCFCLDEKIEKSRGGLAAKHCPEPLADFFERGEEKLEFIPHDFRSRHIKFKKIIKFKTSKNISILLEISNFIK